MGRETRNELSYIAHCTATEPIRDNLKRTPGDLVRGVFGRDDDLDAYGSYDVYVFNHLSDIAKDARRGREEYRPAPTAKTIPAVQRQAAIHLIAYPQKAGRLTSGQLQVASPVRSAVLRSKSRISILITADELDEASSPLEYINGATLANPYTARFPYQPVIDLPEGDIEVVLVNEHGERRCGLNNKERLKLIPRTPQ